MPTKRERDLLDALAAVVPLARAQAEQMSGDADDDGKAQASEAWEAVEGAERIVKASGGPFREPRVMMPEEQGALDSLLSYVMESEADNYCEMRDVGESVEDHTYVRAVTLENWLYGRTSTPDEAADYKAEDVGQDHV
jgi:hypothetical protein